MYFEVRYETEFGIKKTKIELNKLAEFVNRFKIISITKID